MDFRDKMIYIPLIIFAVFAILNLLATSGAIGSLIPIPPTVGNGTIQLPPSSTIVIADWTNIIITLVGLCVLIAAVGIRILGSGLGEKSTHILSTAIVYAGIWTTIESWAAAELATIPFMIVGGQSLIFILLSVFYGFGAFLKVVSGVSSGSEVSE